jgi:signal transduction histidine kinase
VTATNEPAVASRREAEARASSERRVARQRAALRPFGLAVIAAVAAGALGATPRPGLHDRGLGVTLALSAFGVALALVLRDRLGPRLEAVAIAQMGVAGVALAALQGRGDTELAGGAAVWMAVTRLPVKPGLALAACVTVALDVAAALSGSSATAVVAATLLCVLLGVVAHFMRVTRESHDRTELLLAQLQDARDEQTRAAAIAERGRIATELHDVLAHSLSGAAIQLQGARMLAEREQATPQVRAAIDRATELVKDGLGNARRAVGALRGDELPGVAQLESLVASFRDDMDVDVTLTIEGSARTLSAEASLALYRGTQDALTNVARYAPGATAVVVLRYRGKTTLLPVEDRVAGAAGSRPGLDGIGGGRGLEGLRERLERVGGSMRAGAIDGGWRVELEVSA